MTPLKSLLEVAPDEQGLRAGWDAIAARLPGPRRRGPRRGWLAGGALTALAAAVVLVMLRSGGEARPLALADGRPLPGELVADTRLSDGSEIAITDGRLEVIESDARSARWLLAGGTARFSVHPGGPRRWLIDAGAAQVEVIGTVFTVARTPASVTVAVEHGVVVVRGEHVPGLVRRLRAGEQLRVPAVLTAETPSAPATSAAPPGALGTSAAPPGPSPSRAATSSSGARTAPTAPPSGPTSRASTASGPPARHPPLAAALGADPPAPTGAVGRSPSVTQRRSAQAALAEADELRRRGDLTGAIAALGSMDAVPDDPLVAIAWFTRARIALELGQRPAAIADLQRAIAAGLPAALEARARARLDELTRGAAR